MTGMHFGRTWVGHAIEDECPCPKAPCGLAAPEKGSPACAEHNPDDFLDSKTMRQMHRAEHCPGHDHTERCCREHGTHSMPHRGCILR